MANQNINVLIIVTTFIFIMALAFIVLYIVIYNQRKKHHIEEKQQLQANFHQEILKTQIEVQEQTLTNISREIHDNVTQVLSFVKLNLGMIKQLDDSTKTKISESRELVAQTINDLRNLSRSMSFEHIAEQGLIKTIENEATRINNSGLITAVIVVTGGGYPLGPQRELIIFRIFQEGLNNTLKHANAKHLKINLEYSEQIFTLTLEDDGDGFLPDELVVSGGAGLKNMRSRAALIGADAIIKSAPGKGCCIKVTLNPLNTDIYPDANYSNSPG